jgi:hypothetical protein
MVRLVGFFVGMHRSRVHRSLDWETRMADAGADPFTLAAILGHSDIRMTARYTHAMDEAKRRAVDKLVVARALGAVEHGALPNGRATAPALGAGEAPAVPVRAVEKLVAPRLVETRPLPQAVLTKALGAGGKEALPNGRATAPALGAGETPAVPVRALPVAVQVKGIPTAKLGKVLATETKTASSASPVSDPKPAQTNSLRYTKLVDVGW